MRDQAEYPRVLIVGQAFEANTGGGITLANLFQGWPKERLAVAANLDASQNFNPCERLYRFGSLEYRVAWPLAYFQQRLRASGPIDVGVLTKSIQINGESCLLPVTIRQDPVRKMAHSLMELSGLEPLARRLHASSTLYAWIEDFRPDVIYTQLGHLSIITLVAELTSKLKIPFIIHMQDDWPVTPSAKGVMAPYVKWCMNKEFQLLLRRASVLMGISEKMCQAFEQRYKRHFVPFHNPIDTRTWLAVAKKNWKAGDPFRLMYAGRIGRANRDSLSTVCDAVADLHTSGYSIRFDLYTLEHCSDAAKVYLRKGCVFVNPPIPYSLVPSSLAEADLLILPLDFDADSLRFARYSMPTKTAEYMISGTPILVYAPADLALSEYAKEGQWGYVVTEQTGGILKQAICRLMSDQPLREQLGQRAQQLAMRNHDSILVREQFRNVLAEAAKRPEVNRNKQMHKQHAIGL